MKKWFSFDSFKNWINSDLRAEIKELKDINKKQSETKKIALPSDLNLLSKKPWKNVYYNGSNITVVFSSGNTLSNECDIQKYNQIKEAKDEQEIIDLLYNVEKVEKEEKLVTKEEQELVNANLAILKVNDDFEVKGNDVYLKGVNIVLPTIVVSSFIENREKNLALASGFRSNTITVQHSLKKNEQEYQSLKMFTYKLLLNPIPEAKNQLLEILKRYSVVITKNGNFLGYRRILSVGDKNKKLSQFISMEYIRIKGMKKSPKNYTIYSSDDFNGYKSVKLSQVSTNKFQSRNNTVLGNLQELYLNLPNMQENRYTDDYSKSYDIRIGQVYKIKDKDIDLNKNGSCGGSLHMSCGKNIFDYSSFGDTDVLCLINPMHFYKTDSGSSGKYGVKEMFICCTTEFDENGEYKNHLDIEQFDEIYHNETIFQLEKLIKKQKYISIKDKTLDVSLNEIKTITKLLNQRTVSI